METIITDTENVKTQLENNELAVFLPAVIKMTTAEYISFLLKQKEKQKE